MIIYRIEHPDSGFGPWRHSYMGMDLRPLQEIEAARYAVYNDGSCGDLHYTDSMVCGFISKVAYLKWTDDNLRAKLRNFGFTLALYEASLYYWTQSGQAIFQKETSKLIRRLPYLL